MLSIAAVSVNPAGTTGNRFSDAAAVSGDGRFVAFHSAATDLVAGDTNNSEDIFVRDLQTGITVRASVDSGGNQALGNSFSPSISADGRFVAFHSEAANLISAGKLGSPLPPQGDTNGVFDVFVHDMAGSTVRVSVSSLNVQSNGDSYAPSISADGRYIAFESYATNLVGSDNNGHADVFVHDMQSGGTERVSVDSSGAEGNGDSVGASISANGRWVAFYGTASNLAAADANGTYDVFAHDRQTGATMRASVNSLGLEGNGASMTPSIGDDGRFVAFQSQATNLTTGDTNGEADIFVHDLQTGSTELVSKGIGGVPANGVSGDPALSADGHYVVFDSLASNLVAGDTNAAFDIFRVDRQTGTTVRLSVSASQQQSNEHSGDPSVSDDGQVVAFLSNASNLVPNDFNNSGDVFVVQPTTGILTTGADAGGGPHVRVFDATTLDELASFYAFSAAFTGGVRVALGDVTGDSVPDVIAAAGPGGGPHVRVFDGVTFAQISGPLGSFFAFDASVSNGLNVASADVDGDNIADIVVGVDAGSQPEVRVFSGRDGHVLYDFLAMPTAFRGGVRVAAGDVDGDGHADVITGAGPGDANAVHIYSGSSGALLRQFFPFAGGFRGGVYVAARDVNNDGFADIAIGAGAGGGPHVQLFDGATSAQLQSFFAYSPSFSGGVRVGLTEVGGVGEILTAAGPGGGPHVKAFRASDLAEVASFFAYDPRFTGGVFVTGSPPNPNPIGGPVNPLPDNSIVGPVDPWPMNLIVGPVDPWPMNPVVGPVDPPPGTGASSIASPAASARRAALEHVLGAAGAGEHLLDVGWLDTLAHQAAPAKGDELALVL